MKENPVYRLRELIKFKYGHRSFLFGCDLVAQWLRGTAKSHYTKQQIVQLCALQNETNVYLTVEEKEALRQLFGLQSTNALYTKPPGTNLNATETLTHNTTI